MKRQLRPQFQPTRYVFRRKVFKLFGGSFYVYDEMKNPIMFSSQKAFKLKEDISIFTDKTKSEELLRIKTPHLLDISAVYDVTAPSSGEKVGSIKRKGLKSIIKDEWTFLSTSGDEIARLSEKSTGSAILSRLFNIIPQKYRIERKGKTVATLNQHFNPFILKYTLNIDDPSTEIDRRLLVAMGILLCAIERRQK